MRFPWTSLHWYQELLSFLRKPSFHSCSTLPSSPSSKDLPETNSGASLPYPLSSSLTILTLPSLALMTEGFSTALHLGCLFPAHLFFVNTSPHLPTGHCTQLVTSHLHIYVSFPDHQTTKGVIQSSGLLVFACPHPPWEFPQGWGIV